MPRAVRTIAAMLSLTAALVLGVAAPALGQATGRLTVVQGLPNTDVDAYLDGALLVRGLAPESVTDPQAIAAGPHELAVFEEGADPATATPLAERSVALGEADDVTVVVGATPASEVAVSVFTNDTSEIDGDRQGRLVVRHTAAAEETNVIVNGEPAITQLGAGAEEQLGIAPGTYELRFQVSGEIEPALDPFEVPVRTGRSTIIHLIGDASGRFAPYSVVVQTIGGLEPLPRAVPTGDSGLSATIDRTPSAVVVAVVAALVMLGGAAVTVGVQALRSNGGRARDS